MAIIDELFGLNESHLIELPNDSVKIHSAVIAPFMALSARARNAGFDVRVASGFRSFERQLLIWNAKANGARPVLDKQGQLINLNALSDNEKVFAILCWSALPGASRHHWGTDMDIFDASRMPMDYQVQLTVAETENDGPFAEFHRWLDQDLQQSPHGFYRPYLPGIGGISPEPWHISYAPSANIYAAELTEKLLREKIQAADILLKDSILKLLPEIFSRYIAPYNAINTSR